MKRELIENETCVLRRNERSVVGLNKKASLYFQAPFIWTWGLRRNARSGVGFNKNASPYFQTATRHHLASYIIQRRPGHTWAIYII